MGARSERSLRWTFVANRAVERILPPALLWFFFWPLSAWRALRVMDSPQRRLVRFLALGPSLEEKPVSALAQWRFRFEMDHRRIPLSFADRMQSPRWRARFTVEGFGGFQSLARERPVVIVTMHTLSCTLLPTWIRSQGIQAGSVTGGQGWLREDVLWRSRLGQPGTARATFTLGEPRELLRHLNAGHCLVLAADAPSGHTVSAPWREATVRLSTGGFRLATRTGAAVVPIAITSAGRWRYRVYVGTPVPDELVRDGDVAGAARHVVDQLMPVVAAVARQADPTLIEAVVPAAAEAHAA